MTPLVPIVLFGWIPLILALFAVLKPHRAAIAGFLLAWMFLPWHVYVFTGIPNYSRTSATCLGVLLGILIFDRPVLKTFRFKPVDLPILGVCVVPFFTSVANGLGAYDGLSALLDKTLLWGVPWFIGRLYLSKPEHMRDMVLGICIGGLIYIPFVVYEFIMSPRLHRMVYGFHAHLFAQAKRGTGYRPVVFMQHGLMTAMWLMSATFCGFVLAVSGYFRERYPKQQTLWYGGVAALLITTVLNRSAGAFFLLFLAIGIFSAARALRQRGPMLITIVIALLYMSTRATGLWDGQNLIDQAEQMTDAERAGSLEFRIHMETILIEHALDRPLLGWGRWRRSFVTDDDGRIISVPDGLWVLVLGQEGLLGLLFTTLTLVVPILVFLKQAPPATWSRPGNIALMALPILLGIYLVDNLLNNMFNPAFLLTAGGLAGYIPTAPAAENDADTMMERTPYRPRRTRAL